MTWSTGRPCAGADLKCAPADACPWIRQRADFVTTSPGGLGAAREVCELILQARGRLSDWQDSFR
jgi:3-deoxy-D-manno-octulosonate 8-phosphate phosphatase (KDO 8-P phosphatase)